MEPLEPATNTGAPGSVTPLRSNAPVFKRARYQVVGRRRDRCMSLATSAPPLAVRRPAKAQLLLPMPGESMEPLRELNAGALERSSSVDVGIAAQVSASAAAARSTSAPDSLGASQLERSGYKKQVTRFQPCSRRPPLNRESISRRRI